MCLIRGGGGGGGGGALKKARLQSNYAFNNNILNIITQSQYEGDGGGAHDDGWVGLKFRFATTLMEKASWGNFYYFIFIFYINYL